MCILCGFRHAFNMHIPSKTPESLKNRSRIYFRRIRYSRIFEFEYQPLEKRPNIYNQKHNQKLNNLMNERKSAFTCALFNLIRFFSFAKILMNYLPFETT